jgi:hypothetical protein
LCSLRASDLSNCQFLGKGPNGISNSPEASIQQKVTKVTKGKESVSTIKPALLPTFVLFVSFCNFCRTLGPWCLEFEQR